MTDPQPLQQGFTYKRPWLYEKQLAAIFDERRYSWIEGSTKCFPKGTLVATSKGHIPIQCINPGDMVLSWDGSEYHYSKVIKRIDNHGVHDMVRVTTKTQTIEATADHEFRQGSEWHPIAFIAERAVAASKGVLPSLLDKQSGKACNGRAKRREYAVNNEASTRRKGLSSNNAFEGRQGENCEGSQNSRAGLDSAGNRRPDSESQKLRQNGQSGREPRSLNAERQYQALSEGRKIRKIQGVNKRQQCFDRGAGWQHPNEIRSAGDNNENAGAGIRGFADDDKKNYLAQWMEPRCIDDGEIVSVEKYRYTGTLYDLSVEDENYCVTRENINVHNCGKTQPSLAWLFEQSVYMAGKGRAFWWISPVSSQADICFNRMKKNIPRQIIKDISESKKYVELIFGSLIWFKSADKPDSLYGDDVFAAVIDEASRVKADAFTAVRSTLTATNGRLRLIGNVKGRSNWFYKGCRAAEMGLPDHGYHKMTAYDAVAAGILSLEEVEDAKTVLPEHVFKQLYLAEPADDGGNPFGLAAIDACVRPMTLKPPVVWGIDVAKSYDWTVLIGLDEDGNVCRFHRFQLGWPETKSQIKKCVGNKTPALMDSTGVGDPLLEDLQTDGFDNIEGFKFTSPSKQQLMEGLAADIQQQAVGYPDNEIATELRVFEYEYTRTGVKYTAPSGLHDDCVCALALARKKLHAPKPFVYIPE